MCEAEQTRDQIRLSFFHSHLHVLSDIFYRQSQPQGRWNEIDGPCAHSEKKKKTKNLEMRGRRLCEEITGIVHISNMAAHSVSSSLLHCRRRRCEDETRTKKIKFNIATWSMLKCEPSHSHSQSHLHASLWRVRPMEIFHCIRAICLYMVFPSVE